MRTVVFCFAFVVVCTATLFCQATDKQGAGTEKTGGGSTALQYIETDRLNSAATIPLTNINDFLKLISDYGIKHIFYTKDQFYFQAPSMSMPYTIPSNGYKNLDDYQAGGGLYTDGKSYYYAIQNQLNGQEEVDYYKKEYFINPDDFKKAQKDGFVKSKPANRITRISGIIKKADLQKSIYFANAIIWLMYYKSQNNKDTALLGNTDINALALAFSVHNKASNILALAHHLI